MPKRLLEQFWPWTGTTWGGAYMVEIITPKPKRTVSSPSALAKYLTHPNKANPVEMIYHWLVMRWALHSLRAEMGCEMQAPAKFLSVICQLILDSHSSALHLQSETIRRGTWIGYVSNAEQFQNYSTNPLPPELLHIPTSSQVRSDVWNRVWRLMEFSQWSWKF